jgi:hypothetical protein
LIEEPEPFTAPLTENVHVPPEATAISEPFAPEAAGSGSGAGAGIAAAAGARGGAGRAG